MLPPIRCFTCGAPLGHLWEEYSGRVSQGEEPGSVLDSLGVRRYCCRRTLLTTMTYVEELAKYPVQAKIREKVIRKYFVEAEGGDRVS
ncbi:MAG: DNA-directed RNA polymerase subunit N [Thermoprotei archaeon]|nr:DNA-directed RNA polymerase subunit N [Thermoprotei archaeon]